MKRLLCWWTPGLERRVPSGPGGDQSTLLGIRAWWFAAVAHSSQLQSAENCYLGTRLQAFKRGCFCYTFSGCQPVAANPVKLHDQLFFLAVSSCLFVAASLATRAL